MESIRERRFLKVGDVDLAQLANLDGCRILLTGASGWLGKEMLCVLNRFNPRFEGLDLTLTGSYRRKINIHGIELKILSTQDVSSKDKFDLILHFAFTTQEKAHLQGDALYEKGNSDLTNWIVDIAESNDQSKKLILSSGAVERYLLEEYKGSAKYRYASLKRDLESAFLNKSALILRLWNTSGHHMGADPKYALGEFVQCALRDEPIIVEKNLLRTYVAASSILQSSLLYMLNQGQGVVNSGGVETSLSKLANYTISSLDSKSICTVLDEVFYPNDDYVSPATEIPKQYWLENLDLKQQILETASGIQI
jgi:nucleoside-diphosphate-sugar epimerase